MDHKTRLLPHLNACYMQKKAFEVHRKKIDYIKHSIKNSIVKKTSQSHHQHLEKEQILNESSVKKMSTIKQQVLQGRGDRLTPWEKRQKEQRSKQNKRLLKRIETCGSTIKRKDLQIHMLKSKEMRDRICKFKSDPQSHKKLLKSEHSLLRLERVKSKEKLKRHSTTRNQDSSSLADSNTPYRYRSNSKTKSRKLQQHTEPTSEPKDILRKNSFQKFMALRNSCRVQRHFDKQDFASRAKARLTALREGNASEHRRRMKTDLGDIYWKSRCFTTQLQNSH